MSYEVIRNHRLPDDRSVILAAIAAHTQRRGTPPVSLVVHTSRAAAVREALPGLQITGCGGCLVGELWLEVAEESKTGGIK